MFFYKVIMLGYFQDFFISFTCSFISTSRTTVNIFQITINFILSKSRKVYLQEYFKTYDRPKKDDNSYEQMLAQQRQDAMELSYSNNTMSDYVLAKWSSIYHTNSKGNLVIDRKLKVGSDVPKSINMNIKVPTQKYKNRYVYSY